MRTTTLKSVLTMLITVLGASFTALNSAHAALQYNVPVTTGIIDSWAGLVLGQRTSIECEIKANGVPMITSNVLKAFICQLKLLGATNLGTMTIDPARPGFVAGYIYTSPAGLLSIQPPNMVRAIYAFYYPDLPADHLETFIGLTFSSPGPAATSGVLMNSPDQAVLAATASVQNRTVTLGYWTGKFPYFYLDPNCGDCAGAFAGYSNNQLADIIIH